MTDHFVLLGDLMVDVTAIVTAPINHASDTPATIRVQAGGSSANTARWLAAQGHGATFIGAVGADDLGDLARTSLERAGVRARLAVRDDAQTGVCVVIVDATGERTMLPDGGANRLLRPEDVTEDAMVTPGHFHCSGYTLLEPSTRATGMRALRLARDAGLTTSLDAASAAPIAAAPEAIPGAYDLLDLVLANDEEATALTGLPPDEALVALGAAVPTVVVKLGARGALATHGGRVVHADAVARSIVDTTGAGDAFAAGFLPAWRGGGTLEVALRAAQELAAQAVGRVGAGPPEPWPG